MTKALLLGQSKSPHFGTFLELLRVSKGISSQAMLLPQLLMEISMRVSIRKIAASAARLDRTDEATGYHTYKSRPKGDPLSIDFLQTTQSLGSTSTTLGIVEMRLKSLLLMLDFVIKENAAITRPKSSVLGVQYQMQAVDLAQHLNHLRFLCENLLFQAQFLQGRTQRLHQVVSSRALYTDFTLMVYRYTLSCLRRTSSIVCKLQRTPVTLQKQAKRTARLCCQ